jgi:peptidoglycan/LPS O-acetylase OafA/YrhL
MSGELRALTSVRGLAAWMVVLFHIRMSIDGLPELGMAILSKGYLAVDFFFLLSGFVIWMSYAGRIRDGGLGTVPEFLRRRVARVWPLHLFMLAVAAALVLVMAATGHDTGQFPLHELPLHVLLLQNWGFTDALTWNDPAWSISCELAAYLLFPLLALAIDWRRVPTPAILAAITALLVVLHIVFASRGASSLGQEIPRLGLVRCILEFGCGTAMGALWLRWREAWRMPAAVGGVLALLLLTGAIAGLVPETLAVPAGFAAALLALAMTRASPLDARPIHYLGEISYATYLGHYLLWFVFKLAFVDDAHSVSLPLIALYLAMVFASSVALYHLIERPAQRWINRLSLPRPAPRSAPESLPD